MAQNLCKQDEGSEFILTGKGGLAPSPSQTRSRDFSEVNLVEPALFLNNEQQKEADEIKKVESISKVVRRSSWLDY